MTGLAAGNHTLTVRLRGYLEAQRTVSILSGLDTSVADLLLRGGDVNGDCEIDLFDLVLVAANFGANSSADRRADINANGEVDIFDLVLVGANLGRRCPQPWTDAPSARAMDDVGP